MTQSERIIIEEFGDDVAQMAAAIMDLRYEIEKKDTQIDDGNIKIQALEEEIQSLTEELNEKDN